MDTKTTKRAAVYARVSTEEQAGETYSLDSQLEALRQHCQRRGVIEVKNIEK